MSDNADKKPVSSLNPSAILLADAARLLSKVSGHSITESMLRQDIEAGAPANPDGTLHLVTYAAWLVHEMSGEHHAE